MMTLTEIKTAQLIVDAVQDVLVEELGRDKATRLMGRINDRLAAQAEKARRAS
jgi:hypothetical protein